MAKLTRKARFLPHGYSSTFWPASISSAARAVGRNHPSSRSGGAGQLHPQPMRRARPPTDARRPPSPGPRVIVAAGSDPARRHTARSALAPSGGWAGLEAARRQFSSCGSRSFPPCRVARSPAHHPLPEPEPPLQPPYQARPPRSSSFFTLTPHQKSPLWRQNCPAQGRKPPVLTHDIP